MGKIVSINVSKEKGVVKNQVKEGEVIENWGLKGDAHGGDWDRQISIFPLEALEKVPEEKKEEVYGDGYTENFTISGISLEELKVGSTIKLGAAEVKILYIGKDKFKENGRPYIVSREGRFGKVVKGGIVKVDDQVEIID